MTPGRRWREAFVRGLLLLLAVTPDAGAQERISTAQILTNTMAGAAACMAWRPSGTCFWLHCTWWSCSVRTSLRISHYNPDAVVSTFHDEQTHPWSDWGSTVEAALHGPATSLVGQPIDSAGTRTRDDGRDRAKMYRDADAIGHPGHLLPMRGGSVICPNRIRAFQPYFSSFVDARVWRAMPSVESLYPAAWVPGLREVGDWPLNSWGNVYPRDGNVTQQHPVKAAAVLSQRIGDIVTRAAQPHLYTQLPTGGLQLIDNDLVWLPPPLVERDRSTGMWQMLAPRAESACRVFGDDDSTAPTSYGDGQTSGTGGYAFNLWRPYSCCSKAGQVFLGAVTF